jgi:hypothetical protein
MDSLVVISGRATGGLRYSLSQIRVCVL